MAYTIVQGRGHGTIHRDADRQRHDDFIWHLACAQADLYGGDPYEPETIPSLTEAQRQKASALMKWRRYPETRNEEIQRLAKEAIAEIKARREALSSAA